MDHRGIWTEPFQGTYGAMAVLRLSGMARILSAGSRPPIHYLTGLRPTETGLGTSTFVMPATGWLQLGVGTYSGGAMAWVADAPLTSAIATGLAPGWIATTSELSMNFLRAPRVASGSFTGRARTIHANRRVGLSAIEVTDALGRLVAHGTTRAIIVEVPGLVDGDLEESALVGKTGPGTGPAPFEREAVGFVAPPQYWDAMTGLESIEEGIDGKDVLPPVHHLTGLRPIEASESHTVWTLPNTEWLCSPAPYLYGGAIAWFADHALIGAYTVTMERGHVAAPLDLKVQFLRPVFPNTGNLLARGEVVHRGRSIVVARSEVTDHDGRTIALATGSAMVVRGGVRRLLEDDPETLAADAEAGA
jgi:uncharacterized protein (TIGR00369 family)